ncbi:MAG: RNA polymerase sigma factor, partial [Nakamurella sp.]
MTMMPGWAGAEDVGPAGQIGRGDAMEIGSADRPDLGVADTTSVFTELFDRHSRDLYRYLAARVGVSLADDLLADVFVTALRRRHSYDPTRGTARNWLFGIASNELRHHLRSEAGHHAATVRLAGQAASIAGPEDRSFEKADAAEAIRRLAGALQRLPDLDREILLLNSWAQLEPTEIAVAVGIPAGTV